LATINQINLSFPACLLTTNTKLIRAFAANFAAQDVNDVSALPSYGDDQFLEPYYFACF
jgi:hypothetical protein